MQVIFGVGTFAAVRTLDDVTIISEATARAFHRLKQEEESEREETICCTASSTPFAMVMMCLTWLQPSEPTAELLAFLTQITQQDLV